GLEYGRYGVSKVLDTAYRRFLGVGTTFDIFHNILFPYGLNTTYWSFLDTTYWVLLPSWSLTLFDVIAPKVEVLKPSPFVGKRDARAFNDFLYEMEEYMEGVNIVDDASKIKTTTRYLKDIAALWW
nr:putative retrotransposon Gag domain, aspartic peptidase domain protein [Tanacetum cinerariifolium]